MATVVVVLVLVAGAGRAVLHRLEPDEPPEPAASQQQQQDELTVRHAGDLPPAGVEESAQPLGRPGPVPDGSGGYRFLHANGAEPVAYDPCRPLHYVVRSHGESAEMREGVQDAVAALAAATGLRLVDDGTSTEAPDVDRNSYQPTRYGRRWAPLLIAFSDPGELPDLKGDVIGNGGSSSVSVGRDGPLTYVSGQVQLDTPQLLEAGPRERRALTTSVVQHELGHVVGLAHVDDDDQLMYPKNERRGDYGAGDLRGLARLGTGPCRPEL